MMRASREKGKFRIWHVCDQRFHRAVMQHHDGSVAALIDQLREKIAEQDSAASTGAN